MTSNKQKYTFILIDDDPINNLINKKIVLNADPQARVLVFDEAEKALVFLEQNPSEVIDLIFLDINMPLMNGWEFLKIFRERQYQTPVALLTSSIDDRDIETAKIMQVYDYLVKPLKVEYIKNLPEKL